MKNPSDVPGYSKSGLAGHLEEQFVHNMANLEKKKKQKLNICIRSWRCGAIYLS